MKVCFKCKAAKPRSEFYAHPMMGDGLLGKCKECTKADTTASRLAKIEHYRAYDRMRASQPHRKAQAKRINARWAKRYPVRRHAQHVLRAAMLAGKVTPLPCLMCGEKAEAHHPDYSAPLDVVWLCPAHHKQTHALARKAA
jgi:hypothetical protein